MHPPVSVLIPCYKHARFLAQTIESILTQSYQNFELLISDDSSEDGSDQIIRDYARRDTRIRYQLQSPNLGMVPNWNWCLDQARFDLVKFVFGDDYLTSPTSLGALVEALQRRPGLSMATSARLLVDGNSRRVGLANDLVTTTEYRGKDVILECLLKNRNLIGEPSAVLFKRSVRERFDRNFKQLVDLEFWFRLLETGDLTYISEPLCAFRHHPHQQTSLNRNSRVGEQEGLALMVQHLGRLEEFTRQNGSHHRVRLAIFNSLFQARKARSRSQESAKYEHLLMSHLSRRWYALYWARRRVFKPLSEVVEPVLRFLTSRRQSWVQQKQGQHLRFLVVRRRYLGDIVLLSSVFVALRKKYPHAFLAVLVEERFRPVLEMNYDVDEVLTLPRRSLPSWYRFIRKLRRPGFTHVLDFDNRPQTALIGSLSKAPFRATLRHGRPPRISFLYTRKIALASDFMEKRHIVDFYLRLLEEIDVPRENTSFRLEPPGDAREEIGSFSELGSADRAEPLLLIHPGSRSPSRIWPYDRFIEVADRIAHETGACVLFVGGPAEHALLEKIGEQLPPSVHVLRRVLTIPQLAALCERADALLCHDSGPMHLAAGVGTRVIALFGSQNAANWRPLGEGHTVLQPPMPCAQCLYPDKCVREDSYRNYCVQHLSVNEVYHAVLKALADIPAKSQ